MAKERKYMERNKTDFLNIKMLIDDKINELFGYNNRQIQKLLSNSIGIRLYQKMIPPNTDSDPIRSKIGGVPDIGDDFIWPVIDNLPLTFLAQINLDDIKDYSLELPFKGVLYFFVANKSSEDYTQVVQNIKIIYKEDSKRNNKRSGTESEGFEEYLIEFYRHFTLPSYQERMIHDNTFYSTLLDELSELEEYISEVTFGDEDYTRHHMLGDPNAIQGSVRPFWGASIIEPEDVYYENSTAYWNKAEKIGDEFILLLQIDLSDDRIALFNYGDNCLYFGIHKKDLENKNFNNVKLVIQNT